MFSSRRSLLSLGLIAGVTAITPVLAGGTTLETRLFKNTGTIVIPDSGPANPYPSIITVSGFQQATVHRVVVTLRKLTHSHLSDLDVMLVAPNGAAAILMSDAGGNTDADKLTLTFDAAADEAIPTGPGVVSGTYKPANYGTDDVFPAPAPQGITTDSLKVFKGANPNGKWRLYVRDDANQDDGEILQGWRLEITAQVPK